MEWRKTVDRAEAAISTLLEDKLTDNVLVILLLVSAFLLPFLCGQRGLDAPAQSIVFDGGYRVLSGQVAYKDFATPYGLPAFFIQAVSFYWFEVNWTAYLVCAGALNVVGVVCAMMIARMVFPSLRAPSYAAGLLTGVWLFPPFGTPGIDQVAVTFVLLSATLLMLSESSKKSHPKASGRFVVLAGILAVFALLSRPHIGLFGFPLHVGVIAVARVPDWRGIGRGILSYAIGLALCSGAFLGWLALRSEFSLFFRFFPQGFACGGLARSGGTMDLLGDFVLGSGPAINVYAGRAGMVASLLMLIWYLCNFKRVEKSWRGAFWASALCIFCVLYQNLLIMHSPEGVWGLMGFSGLIAALGCGLSYRLLTDVIFTLPFFRSAVFLKHTGKVSLVVAVTLFAAVLVLFGAGMRVAFDRRLHAGVSGSYIEDEMEIEGLERLRWASPTSWNGQEVFPDNLTHLVEWLREHEGNFFVYKNSTFLYGLLGVPSPQPVLWFAEGLDDNEDLRSELDVKIVAGLTENNVKFIVIDSAAEGDALLELAGYPLTKTFIEKWYVNEDQFGIYQIFKRRMRENRSGSPPQD